VCIRSSATELRELLLFSSNLERCRWLLAVSTLPGRIVGKVADDLRQQVPHAQTQAVAEET